MNKGGKVRKIHRSMRQVKGIKLTLTSGKKLGWRHGAHHRELQNSGKILKQTVFSKKVKHSKWDKRKEDLEAL